MKLGLHYNNLKHRVSLYERLQVIGEGGRKTVTWQLISNVWADLKPKPLGAVQRAERMEYPVTHTLMVPYHSSYLTTRRIDYGSRQFVVKSTINVNEENHWIQFQCEEET